MTPEDYGKLFKISKSDMDLRYAAAHVHQLKDEYPLLPNLGRFNRTEYNYRMAIRVVCDEVEQAIRNASPWEDWREIFARLEWPIMQRVARHSMEDIYDEEDGEKWAEADIWFLNLWVAYHAVFLRMPGGPLPDIRPWRIYYNLMDMVHRKLKAHRRDLNGDL